MSLKNELLNCNQHTGESIDDYVYRLRKKAKVAYKNPENANENCLLAFLRGLQDHNMRIKLGEATCKLLEHKKWGKWAKFCTKQATKTKF